MGEAGFDRITVANCPACGSASRAELHPELVDGAFRFAKGSWPMARCLECSSGYLRECPSPRTIHLAYGNYYTHGDPVAREDFESLSLTRRLRRLVVNGYVNHRFGARLQPASPVAGRLAALVPWLRAKVDSDHRDLPALSGTGHLLDIGCGSGGFLGLARDMGWQVLGVEPDPDAVEACTRLGLDVRVGDVGALSQMSAAFDVVTLNHVLEHVHEPVELLEHCRRLLKPGGTLWIETPNIESLGHRFYGADWRGLEAPRHLVVFSFDGLRAALRRAGFSGIERLPRPSPASFTFRASERMRRGEDAHAPGQAGAATRLLALLASVVAACLPRRREFLTLRARVAGAAETEHPDGP
jgi:2-polyprenyl-3-methyl-5-hydroxy-6-metoxy-1,4-benzoquinol methylase